MMHYHLKYPDAPIAFLTKQVYGGAHEGEPYRVFPMPNNGVKTAQDRLELWPYIRSLGVDIVLIPAVHPFGEVYKENVWSHSIISDQYMHNAGITDRKPLGGRKYRIHLKEADRQWAKDFFRNKTLNPNNCIVIEYNSYSHPVPWLIEQWSELYRITPPLVQYIGVAGKNEGMIPGVVDARGITWKRTVALCELVPKMIGIGSGLTMLAAGAKNPPQIYEINCSDSITMSSCGYADSIQIRNANPQSVLKAIDNWSKK